MVDSEEHKTGVFEWEYRVLSDDAVELQYVIKDNRRVKL